MGARYSIDLKTGVCMGGCIDGYSVRECDTEAEAMAEFEDSAASMLMRHAGADNPSWLARHADLRANNLYFVAVTDWGEDWRDEDSCAVGDLAEIRLDEWWAVEAARAWEGREKTPLMVAWEYREAYSPNAFADGRARTYIKEELESYGEWEDFILDLIARANGERRPESWHIEAPRHSLEPGY